MQVLQIPAANSKTQTNYRSVRQGQDGTANRISDYMNSFGKAWSRTQVNNWTILHHGCLLQLGWYIHSIIQHPWSSQVKPCCFRVFCFHVNNCVRHDFHHFHLSCHEPRNALSQCNPSTLLASKQWLLNNQKHIQRLKKAYQTQVIRTKYTERINERTAKDVGRGMALLGPEWKDGITKY